MAYGLLKGKRGIISGALNEDSIAWKIAQRAHQEGATFTLTNAPLAMRMGEINNLAEQCGAKIIGADATSIEDLEKLYDESMEFLGGPVDFVLHSIGMSTNIRKGREYSDLNYEWFLKSIDVSALSFHKMMQVAQKKRRHRRRRFRGRTFIYRCTALFPRLYRHGPSQSHARIHRP